MRCAQGFVRIKKCLVPELLRLMLFLLLLSPTGSLSAQEHVVKIASLAPAGTVWMKSTNNLFGYVQGKSRGQFRAKVYHSGIIGDEPEVIRKMNLGLLDGACLTVYGLSVICPEMLVLEMPFLFGDRASDEVLYLYRMLRGDFDRYAQKRGYKLLVLDAAGFGHIFTRTPGRLGNLPEALPALKFWQWENEPVWIEFFKSLGVSTVPISLPRTLDALKEGRIDGCIGTPMHILSVRWSSYVRAMYRPSVFFVPAVTALRLDTWNRLPKDIQGFFLDEGMRTIAAEIPARSLRADDRTMEVLEESGIQMLDMNPAERESLQTKTQEVWKASTGKLFPQELLDRVIGLLDAYRKNQGTQEPAT